jgi:hypothetical protein
MSLLLILMKDFGANGQGQKNGIQGKAEGKIDGGILGWCYLNFP